MVPLAEEAPWLLFTQRRFWRVRRSAFGSQMGRGIEALFPPSHVFLLPIVDLFPDPSSVPLHPREATKNGAFSSPSKR
uniref:Uncharacterized protein n=1 Tax=Globodera rostochiensis TaxID=31243 RepID=A0A914I8S4_GLORO